MNDSVREALCRIIDEYTTSVCSDYRRFENLLRDLCSRDRLEVSLLSRALTERVAAELLLWHHSAPRLPREVIVARLSKRLEINQALTDKAARWAVESWAAALLRGAQAAPPGRWYQFSGEGSKELAGIALDAGLALFETTYDGPDNLLVDLWAHDRRYYDLVANVLGMSHVTKPLGIHAGGQYELRVRAVGKWSVEVRQREPEQAGGKPVTFAGLGQQATSLICLESGATHFRATHAGKSNFIVTLLSSRGGYVELVSNEIGTCQISRTVHVELPGSYLLDVSGDGEWEIAVL